MNNRLCFILFYLLFLLSILGLSISVSVILYIIITNYHISVKVIQHCYGHIVTKNILESSGIIY